MCYRDSPYRSMASRSCRVGWQISKRETVMLDPRRIGHSSSIVIAWQDAALFFKILLVLLTIPSVRLRSYTQKYDLLLFTLLVNSFGTVPRETNNLSCWSASLQPCSLHTSEVVTRKFVFASLEHPCLVTLSCDTSALPRKVVDLVRSRCRDYASKFNCLSRHNTRSVRRSPCNNSILSRLHTLPRWSVRPKANEPTTEERREAA